MCDNVFVSEVFWIKLTSLSALSFFLALPKHKHELMFQALCRESKFVHVQGERGIACENKPVRHECAMLVAARPAST